MRFRSSLGLVPQIEILPRSEDRPIKGSRIARHDDDRPSMTRFLVPVSRFSSPSLDPFRLDSSPDPSPHCPVFSLTLVPYHKLLLHFVTPYHLSVTRDPRLLDRDWRREILDPSK